MVLNVKTAISEDVALCSLVKCTMFRKILLAPSTHRTGSHLVGSSVRPVHVYQITQCNIPHNNLKYFGRFRIVASRWSCGYKNVAVSYNIFPPLFYSNIAVLHHLPYLEG